MSLSLFFIDKETVLSLTQGHKGIHGRARTQTLAADFKTHNVPIAPHCLDEDLEVLGPLFHKRQE